MKPELPFDFITFYHLAMEWGHLVGFTLWLVATSVGLLDARQRRRKIVFATWAGFSIQVVTGLYKMRESTPFPGGLSLFNMTAVPRIFFAWDYALTLMTKHLIMLAAMLNSIGLVAVAWRTAPSERVGLWRALLTANLVFALAIAGAAVLLRFYHEIILHFAS